MVYMYHKYIIYKSYSLKSINSFFIYGISHKTFIRLRTNGIVLPYLSYTDTDADVDMDAHADKWNTGLSV